MVNRTITDRIYDSYHKGQDPEFERGGVRYKFNPEGLKDFILSGSPEVSWDDVTDKPATFAPSTHTHTVAQITGLQTALDGKALKTELPTVGVAVTDATNDTDIVAQFNALLASLRAANIIAS